MDLEIANLDQAKEIYKILKKYYVFEWLRYDALCRRIEENTCCYQDGIVITYGRYKVNRKTYGIQMHKGDVMLYQIANKDPGNGKALPILKLFLESVGPPVYLSVRKNNDRAKKLYEKAGFTVVGETIIGNREYFVYKYDKI